VPSHLPVGPHLHRVHRTQGLLAGFLDQSTQLPEQFVEGGWSGTRIEYEGILPASIVAEVGKMRICDALRHTFGIARSSSIWNALRSKSESPENPGHLSAPAPDTCQPPPLADSHPDILSL
jgi:hypothetical protein